MMLFDVPYLVLLIACLAVALGAQAWVSSAVRAQSRVALQSLFTGAEVAAIVVRSTGLEGVRISETAGWLSDHYDPSSRTLFLSSETYQGRSVASAGIAAHEAGHAIQHARRYWPMWLRQRLAPIASIGTQLGVLIIVMGLAVRATGVAELGVIVFASFVLFTVVTLPVEIDASRRARAALKASGMLSAEELAGVSRVLRAAAATYLAAAFSAVMQLAYFTARVTGLGRRRA